MQTITLILANTLLLLILTAGVCIERRVSRLELTRGREAARTRGLRCEIEQLRQHLTDAEEPEPSDADTRRAKDAERRFTEGVASILGYGLHAAGKEIENAEDAGA